MTKGAVVGHAPCPYCKAENAEVKHDKRGNPYLICWECPKPSQHFTLGDAARIKALLGDGKFKALQGVELPAWCEKPAAPAPAAVPPKPASPAVPAAKKTTLMG